MDPQTPQLTPADQLFGQPYKRRFKTLTLPVCGATVRIRSLSEKEMSAHQQSLYVKTVNGWDINKSLMESAGRRFMALCLVDGEGNAILAISDSAKFVEWDSADSTFLYNECRDFTRSKPEDIEGTAKN
jgi:hypothetical protein